jgi:YHS domain-containing protein
MFTRMNALAWLAFGIITTMSAATVAWPDDAPATGREFANPRKALQEVQDFIGPWNLEGVQKAAGKTTTWKEKVSWGWKFKEGDAWLTVDFADGKGKYFANGTLKYDLKKKKYILALTGADKTEQVFEGDLAKGGGLRLDRRDAKTGDVHRITMNTLAEGIRYQLRYERQGGGKGLFATVYSMVGSKEGESIAGAKKKPECIVSGGAATISVSFQGQQYFVCCTGCRDEFNANPEKYVKAVKK